MHELGPWCSHSPLLAAGAYAILSVAGAVLWKRRRSLATMMVAFGFAMMLIDQVIVLVEYYQLTALVHGHASDTFFIVHRHAFVEYLLGSLGLWLAAIGLIWHALRDAGR